MIGGDLSSYKRQILRFFYSEDAFFLIFRPLFGVSFTFWPNILVIRAKRAIFAAVID